VLAALAVVTFLSSWIGLFPTQLVESLYARGVFPWISSIAAIGADAAPFSWLDFWIIAALGILIYSVARRRWMFLLGAASLFYLVFFWGWGLNYHRPALASRMRLTTEPLQPAEFGRFAERVAQEMNRLWPLSNARPLTAEEAGTEAAQRVGRVVSLIDGTDWRAPSRLKHSWLANPWYRMASIDGIFNPYGHEPVVVSGLLPFENPFLMAHELAHVRGIANEGEANLVALLATMASEDPRVQYSGWLQLWSYVGAAPKTKLEAGPLSDLTAIRDRIDSGQVALVSRIQWAILDAHLKANAVPAGVHSYSEFVSLAIATEQRWSEFR
jgi:hypothetical protein